MGNLSASRRGERGFTLIEVLVASTVLLLAAFAAFQLIDGANATTTVNGARVGATNLTRELTEYARGTDYDQLQPSTLVDALRKNAPVAGSGPSPWTIDRRGVTYTVTASVCTYDDPKDGLADPATPPNFPCSTSTTTTTPKDVNPDDFRRVTINLAWKVRGRAGKMTQAVLVVNPSGGLGPRITAFDQPAGDINSDGVTSVSWGAGLKLTTTATAAGVHWTTDDGLRQGDASGGPTDWSFTWSLGSPKLSPLTVDGSWVLDGNYTVQAQAVDGRGVPGDSRVVTVHVNRHPPAAVAGFEGGFDAQRGVVDMHWNAYPERDVRGYRVYRGSTLVCPSDGSSYTTKRVCADPTPGPVGSTQTYSLVAVDCTSLAVTMCSPREGTPTTKQITLTAGPALPAPGPITATVVDGLPKLDWPAVTGAKFYRIYRDTGTGLNDRYDETITSDPTYTDPHPGNTTQHTYWVTAVGSSFNESAASPSVTSPGS
jgi:prepilin-type N-terminal cleavage/methylation domain-containing protein